MKKEPNNDDDGEKPLPGRCNARTRSRGRTNGAKYKYCRNWPAKGEKHCRLWQHNGGAATKRGKPKTHGLRRRFLDAEGAEFYKQARKDIDESGGIGSLADLAAFTIAKVNSYAVRCAADETLDDIDPLLRAEQTARHLIETRHRIEIDRAGDKNADESLTVIMPQWAAEEPLKPPPAMLMHASGEQRRALIDPNGQMLIQGPDLAWHQAIEVSVDGQIRYSTAAELEAERAKHCRPLALLEFKPQSQEETSDEDRKEDA